MFESCHIFEFVYNFFVFLIFSTSFLHLLAFLIFSFSSSSHLPPLFPLYFADEWLTLVQIPFLKIYIPFHHISSSLSFFLFLFLLLLSPSFSFFISLPFILFPFSFLFLLFSLFFLLSQHLSFLPHLSTVSEDWGLSHPDTF